MYRLRKFGERLPRADVQARPATGVLRFGDIPGTSQPRAELLDWKTGVQVDEIRTAKIVKIDTGVLITGFESHPGRGATRQTWYCLPGPLDDITTLP